MKNTGFLFKPPIHFLLTDIYWINHKCFFFIIILCLLSFLAYFSTKWVHEAKCNQQ